MQIDLTDSQRVLLDWDSSEDAPKPVKVLKGKVRYDLSPDEISEIREVSETLSVGADPSTTRAAKALLRKLAKAEGKTHV